jgi:serine/threonine protein kinase
LAELQGERLPKSLFGEPFSIASFKGWIHPYYNHPHLVQSLRDCHSLFEQPGSKILMDKRNRIGVVRLPFQDGQRIEVVIKEFEPHGIDKLKSYFLPSKAFKAWCGAASLVARQIETPCPIAYLEQKKKGFLHQSFFLAEEISGVEEIRSLFRGLPPLELRNLLASLARHLLNCHQKGILHRDLSDGNVLVKKDQHGDYIFYLVDTNRIRERNKIGLLKRVKNLVRLGIPPADQDFFLEQYLVNSLHKKLPKLWYRWNKKAFASYIGLKKKLRLRQLSRILRIQ